MQSAAGLNSAQRAAAGPSKAGKPAERPPRPGSVGGHADYVEIEQALKASDHEEGRKRDQPDQHGKHARHPNEKPPDKSSDGSHIDVQG